MLINDEEGEDSQMESPQILKNKRYDQPSEFTANNLLQQARRQRALPEAKIPQICVLDPDGDIVRYLVKGGIAECEPRWACYHTLLHTFNYQGIRFGIVGLAVGAPFAVLVAEELFASGCKLLVSMTSAGQITPLRKPPYFVLIEKAFRDEGTSYHYLPPEDYARIDDALFNTIKGAFKEGTIPVEVGTTWTTDAPFRETRHAIRHYRSKKVCAVEMEAAGLYAYARATKRNIICFAHITNQMGKAETDFEKGPESGSTESLRVIASVAHKWTASNGQEEPKTRR